MPVVSALMLRVNESSAKINKFAVFSYNVHGLRDEAKLEHIPCIIKNKHLDAYLVQKTHLAGNFKKYLMFDCYIIHHDPEVQPANEANGGLAIILSPDSATTWKTSRKAKKCIKGGLSACNTTRFLSVNLRFGPTEENLKDFHNLCLILIYFPHSGYKRKK